MVQNYIPILMMMGAGVLFGIVFVKLNEWFGPKNWYDEKLTTYESGMEPVRTARERFTVKFYLIAVFFILFDIEVVFLYSWAVVFKEIRTAGLISMALFIFILEVGHFYIWRKGALEWD
jgi:NADH-quinone oxidoreductase subunit A